VSSFATSAPNGKKISQQTYAISAKIKDIDDLLRARPELRTVIREIHPEVCFCKIAGKPMAYRKTSPEGRKERKHALKEHFPRLAEIAKLKLPSNDVLDAVAACWSAQRRAEGKGRSIPDPVPFDTTGLPMAIWV
jgi:predicted RNase H-like nuclease